MSDEEVVRALLVLARKLGVENRLVVAIQHGIGNREEVREEDALCLAFGTYGQVRLCCTEGHGHAGKHSWERAMVGKGACIAVAGQNAGAWMCQRPTHHAGEHEATGADGVRWTWGDAPRIPLCHAVDGCIHEAGHRGDHETRSAPRAAKGCVAWEWGTNGHRAGCMLRAGHEGPHKGLDADGKSIFTWPCPCYPDCTGHTVPGVCGFRVSDLPGALVCELPAGHDGDHATSYEAFKVGTLRSDLTEPRAS